MNILLSWALEWPKNLNPRVGHSVYTIYYYLIFIIDRKASMLLCNYIIEFNDQTERMRSNMKP